MSQPFHGVLGALICFLGVTATLRAEVVSLPNASFESPATTFVNINIDSWQKTPEPAWYTNESGGFLWTQLAGLFQNRPAGSSDHIDNCNGAQAGWLFAVPEVGLFQDYDSTDWSTTVPTHAFDAKFEVGRSYQLTVGVIGGGGNMTEGASLELSLYYRDAASNMVTVAATTVTNTLAIFSNTTHLVDCRVQTPVVQASDAWAGQRMGVRFLSTVSMDLQGGYWDLDNVRLTSAREPLLVGPFLANGQIHFALLSDPGLRFDMLASTNLSVPLSNWISLGTVTNLTGSMPFTDAATNSAQRFYRARQLP